MPGTLRNDISSSVLAVGRSIAALDTALRRLVTLVPTATPDGSTPRSRRKLTITPARRAALKLQGQYMGYLRNLKPRQKAEVKAVKV